MDDVDVLKNARWIQEQEHELWPGRKFDHRDCRACGPGPLGRGMVPSQFPHVFYRMDLVQSVDDYGHRWSHEEKRRCAPEDATIVSSEVADRPGFHTIMLDIDMTARLVESSTPGHFHLYIDRLLTWWQYRRLLRLLWKIGVIEKGFYKASLRRKATNLRPPWVEK